jgi:hypothetical protein
VTVDTNDRKPLPLVFEAAVTEFHEWSDAYLYAKEARNKVAAPLYHYTDAAGLEGIVKNHQVWFTSYTHLNDPTEIEYGMSIASELLNEIGQGSDPRIKIFCDMVNDRFTHKNLHSAFGFFIASFSQEPDNGERMETMAVASRSGWLPTFFTSKMRPTGSLTSMSSASQSYMANMPHDTATCLQSKKRSASCVKLWGKPPT